LTHRFVKKLDLIDWSNMSPNKHDLESEGSKPRDHVHLVNHTWHPHKDWRVWTAVVLMLALVLVYVVTDNLSLRPGQPPTQPTPAFAP
jgi:hypothetical protein